MGVHGLWPLLNPTKQKKSLKSLKGQTVAVDLSGWVVENSNVREMKNRVMKPHLRTLFFRTSALLQHGVNLIFVIEGEAPKMKQAEMDKRLQSRFGPTTGVGSKHRYSRPHLKALLRECCELLDAMGVPYLQSRGEAETLCAVLNQAGIVDACVSDDGDCFLYGATTVYKNLTLDSKDPHVDSYSMEDIQSQLGLTRERLVALALLLGCDYYPAGVPGVGEAWALKLLTSLNKVNILERFEKWKGMKRDSCLDGVEVFVWQRAAALPDFPPHQVIEEFMAPKEKLPAVVLVWERPKMRRMIEFAEKYLEWPRQYSLDKIMPLTTLWDQRDLLQDRIVKKRVRQGVPCFEIEWQCENEDLLKETGEKQLLVTLEEQELFGKCFPSVVAEFTQQITASKPPKKRAAGKKTKVQKENTESLVNQLETLTLTESQSAVSQSLSLPPVQQLVLSKQSAGGRPKCKETANVVDLEEQQTVQQSAEELERFQAVGGLPCTVADERDVLRDLHDTSDCLEVFVPLSQRLRERIGKVGTSVAVNEKKRGGQKTAQKVKTQIISTHLLNWSDSDDGDDGAGDVDADNALSRSRYSDSAFLPVTRVSQLTTQSHSTEKSLSEECTGACPAVPAISTLPCITYSHEMESPKGRIATLDLFSKTEGELGKPVPGCDVSDLGSSYVSDGHFTLHHSLFTSMDCSGANVHSAVNSPNLFCTSTTGVATTSEATDKEDGSSVCREDCMTDGVHISSSHTANETKTSGCDKPQNLDCVENLTGKFQTTDKTCDERELSSSELFLPLSQRLKLRQKGKNVDALKDVSNFKG
ncbi:hypothetical protein BaRGS_00029013 [Batillaria attramentaria]|uniref:Flap endonuclease GEN homolog 1 n=1 Tax=Batillaria attramentaria TaxID=370345 RepID=A0ABD0JXH0_9CAEN